MCFFVVPTDPLLDLLARLNLQKVRRNAATLLSHSAQHASRLRAAGFSTPEELAQASVEALLKAGLPRAQAEQLLVECGVN